MRGSLYVRTIRSSKNCKTVKLIKCGLCKVTFRWKSYRVLYYKHNEFGRSLHICNDCDRFVFSNVVTYSFRKEESDKK